MKKRIFIGTLILVLSLTFVLIGCDKGEPKCKHEYDENGFCTICGKWHIYNEDHVFNERGYCPVCGEVNRITKDVCDELVLDLAGKELLNYSRITYEMLGLKNYPTYTVISDGDYLVLDGDVGIRTNFRYNNYTYEDCGFMSRYKIMLQWDNDKKEYTYYDGAFDRFFMASVYDLETAKKTFSGFVAPRGSDLLDMVYTYTLSSGAREEITFFGFDDKSFECYGYIKDYSYSGGLRSSTFFTYDLAYCLERDSKGGNISPNGRITITFENGEEKYADFYGDRTFSFIVLDGYTYMNM